MNGVHDLGGTDGLGPVVVPDREPVFTAEWEKAAFAMFSMCFRAGFFGVDEFRYGIEQMHPAVYLLSPYYEHWIHTVEHYGKAKGLLDLEEVDRRTQYYLEHPDAPLPQREDPDLVAALTQVCEPRAARAFAIIPEFTAVTLSDSPASKVASSTRSSRSGAASPLSKRCWASLAAISASCRARCTPIVVGSVLLISLLARSAAHVRRERRDH